MGGYIPKDIYSCDPNGIILPSKFAFGLFITVGAEVDNCFSLWNISLGISTFPSTKTIHKVQPNSSTVDIRLLLPVKDADDDYMDYVL